MYRVKLTKEDELILHKKIKEERDGRILKRYQCIMMNHQEIQNMNIARILGIQMNTVTIWVKIYLEEGLEKLSNLEFTGKRQSVLEDIKEEIKAQAETGIVSSMSELANWIKKEYNHEVETSWLGRWCKKNSIFLLKSQD